MVTVSSTRLAALFSATLQHQDQNSRFCLIKELVDTIIASKDSEIATLKQAIENLQNLLKEKITTFIEIF